MSIGDGLQNSFQYREGPRDMEAILKTFNFTKLELGFLLTTKMATVFLTIKGSLSLRGTNEIWASIYELKFFFDFLKLFLKIENLISFVRI